MIAVVVVSTTACSVTSPSGNTDSTPTVTTERAPEESLSWSRCDGLECARLEMLVDQDDPDGRRRTRDLVRRAGVDPDDDRVIVLVPDRLHGDDARTLIRNVPVSLGPQWSRSTLVAMDVRGTDESVSADGASRSSSIADLARDIRSVRVALGEIPVKAIGWGDGASALAIVAMETPDLFEAMVLDSPTAVHRDALDRLESQIDSDAAVVDAALAWCASHISCVMNANVARGFNAFKTNLRLGLLSPMIDYGVVGAAARWSLARGDISGFFRAVSEATTGSGEELLAMSRIVADEERLGNLCAEVTGAEAESLHQRLIRRDSESTAHFRMGNESALYAMCDSDHHAMASTSPGIDARAGGARVLVVGVVNNPVTGVGLSRDLAGDLGWELLEVPLFAVAAVGVDPDTTQRAFDFLTDRGVSVD